MSYQVYATDALVLRSMPAGEADRTLALFTSAFGLTYARARGIRHERSKLRYSLQEFSGAHVSLVRGKGGWRIAGGAVLDAVAMTPEGAAAFARVAGLVLRLVHGEEENEVLYETLTTAREKLLPGGPNLAILELIFVARILQVLGYVAARDELAPILTAAWTDDFVHKTVPFMNTLRTAVNEAIVASQL